MAVNTYPLAMIVNLLIFLAIFGFSTVTNAEESVVSVQEFLKLQEIVLRHQDRIKELETRLSQDECPCDLSKLGDCFSSRH